MEPRHKDLLRRMRLELCAEGLADGLAPQYLYQEGILTDAQLEDILSQATSQRKAMKLLDILPTRGPKAFKVFLESLTEFPWVQEKLELQCKEIVDVPRDNSFEVPARLRSSCPTDRQLSLLAARLGSEWEQILVHLGLDANDVYKCKAQHPCNVNSQVLEGLVKWKQRMGSRATVQCLVDALQAAEVDPSLMQHVIQ